MTEPDRPTHATPHQPLPLGLILLAGFIALVEGVLSLADAGIIPDHSLRQRVYMAGAFWAELLRGEPPLFAWQPVTMFVSHAFLHGGLGHMVMNLAILLGLGKFVGERYGAGAILPVFLVSAVAGGAAFGLLASGTYPMVGASGAVFGFLGVWTVWDWRRHRAAGAPARPVVMRVAGLVLINLLLFIGLQGMLAWEAHLGGFLAGLAAGCLLEHGRTQKARTTRAAARRDRLSTDADYRREP